MSILFLTTLEYGSAVCVLDDYASIKGVVRFAQFAEDKTFIEVYITGLSPGKHGIHIHAYGDISDGDNTIGMYLMINDSIHEIVLQSCVNY